MFRRALIVLLAVATLATSCSGVTDASSATEPERETPRGSILPPADPDGIGPGLDLQEPQPENTDDGRLVVQHADHQLSTMLPDGTETEPLTEPGTINSQAAWAPDGSRVAWVSQDESSGELTISLDRYDRSDLIEISVDEHPFYLYWDPASARIAHLGGSAAGIDLSIAEPYVEDGPTTRRIDRGEPYFISWGPDGDELLVHASGFRLDRIDMGDATIIIDEFPANFGAASWLADNSLVYADIVDGEQFLVSTGARGEGRRPLVSFDGALTFAVNNDGNRVVMQARPAQEQDSVVTASTDPNKRDEPSLAVLRQDPTPTPGFDDSLDAIDQIEPGIPYMMGTFGGDPFPLSNKPALAIFPSPDGQAIAWFEPVDARGSVTLMVDFGGSIFTSPAFIPSQVTLNDYLPFYDQYEQSHNFWSPSSSLFAFAGRHAGERTDGIFVFDRATGDISRITDGVVASFTRSEQAAGAGSAL